MLLMIRLPNLLQLLRRKTGRRSAWIMVDDIVKSTLGLAPFEFGGIDKAQLQTRIRHAWTARVLLQDRLKLLRRQGILALQAIQFTEPVMGIGSELAGRILMEHALQGCHG